MATKWVSFLLFLLILLGGFSLVSASPPARIMAGIVTNVVSTLFKWLWSLRTPTKTEKAVMNRSTIKFEGGYTVETIFDGSKVGIDPYSIEATPTGELLIIDSTNSNLYRISTPLSKHSRPKLVSGSPEGYTGHVDGKLREARMYHPKGVAVDDSGNIYIADTLNMAIRKISDAGITTIAGGKWSHGDGLSDDAKLSDDFDVVYIRSSCSLLVTDRGNQAIREIQLHDDDCSYDQPQVQTVECEENLHLGIAVLGAAIFFGYMLALLKQRVQSLFYPSRGQRRPQFNNNHAIMPPYQGHPKPVRPPLMPTSQDNADEYEDEEEDEGLFFSFGRLIFKAGSSVAELFTGLLFWGFRRKRPRHQNMHHLQHLNRHPTHSWPNMQETYAFRGEDEPPPPALEPRRRTPPNMRKTYENAQETFRQGGRVYYEAQDGEFPQHQGQIQQQQQQQQKQQLQKQRPVSGNPKGSEEKGAEKSEIVFGAVQEQDGRREAMVIKAVDFSDPIYSQQNIRPRLNYMGYSAYSYS